MLRVVLCMHAPRRKGEYVFAADNPFKGDAQAFAKGKDLFRCGQRRARGTRTARVHSCLLAPP